MSLDEKNKYGGHQYDVDTDLNYFGARYYHAKIGRFISEDPSATFSPETFLIDPQQLNTYSYARDNPVTVVDPDGKQVVPALIAATGLLVSYSPQITSFVQSLASPLGQFSVYQAGQDVQKGNYGWAVFGFATAGEVLEGKGILRMNEELGGHAIERHVEKTVEELGERLGASKRIPSSTAYHSESLGDVATYKILQDQSQQINSWLNMTENFKTRAFSSDIGTNIGHGIDRAGNYFKSIDQARAVLQKDTSLPRGYKIISSFPLLK